MATDVSSQVNGHGPNSSYEYSQPQATQSAQSTTNDIPKDEVGWFFVERYFSVMASSPEKLYLFYNKRSQFVLGDEAEKADVDVGQKAISERFKKLEFQDSKVRISNVDAQASDSNVVIQVIGEISNKSQPARKFVQTFVLAQQTNGYFVLNDIFRYLVDEEEEPQAEETVAAQENGYQEPTHSANEVTTQSLSASSDPAAIEKSANLVDEVLQSKAEEAPAVVNGAHDQEESALATTAVSEEPVAESAPPVIEPEKPAEPSPSPSRQTPQPAASAVAQPPPSKPAVPKTWANLAAAANRGAAPAVPSQAQAAVPSANAQKPSQSAQPPPAAAAAPAAAAPESTQAQAQDIPAQEAQDDEWTSVGDHKKQQSRAQGGNHAQDNGPQSRAYIKNVHENVDAKALRQLLERFGEIQYLDIARAKNCAFVDFKTPEGYKAAVDANPHQLGEDRIIVEERRVKPGSYPYVPRGGARGGRGGIPQGNAGGQRGNFQGGRGGYVPRGRGGAGNAARGGRGGAAQAS